MKRPSLTSILAMSLFSLASPKFSEAVDPKFQISGNVGTYLLPESVTSVNGFPYGGGVAIEGRKGFLGFKAGLDAYMKRGNSRAEYNSRGEVKEGERETAETTRIYGGIKLGNEDVSFEGGIVGVEASDVYETTDSGFLGRQEVSQFPSRTSMGGLFVGFNLGGKIRDELRFYVNFAADYLSRGVEEPITGIKFGVGIKKEL